MIELFEQFTSSISEIYRYILKIEREEMAKYGLRGPHAQYLIAMNRYEELGVTLSGLCKICDKDKAAVSRAIAELETEGLVRRISMNGVFYRAPLRLTEKGRIAAQKVNSRAKVAVEKAGVGMNEEQRIAFYETLQLIAGNLQKLSLDGIDA